MPTQEKKKTFQKHPTAFSPMGGLSAHTRKKKKKLFKNIQPLKNHSSFKKYLKYHSLKYTKLSHITDIQPIKTIRYIEPIKSIFCNDIVHGDVYFSGVKIYHIFALSYEGPCSSDYFLAT